jgi:hypothetical protein
MQGRFRVNHIVLYQVTIEVTEQATGTKAIPGPKGNQTFSNRPAPFARNLGNE